jgi:hypothetical protein
VLQNRSTMSELLSKATGKSKEQVVEEPSTGAQQGTALETF